MRVPKRLFLFYASFSLRLTENLHEQKHFLKNIYMFCLYNFSLKCTIKKLFVDGRLTFTFFTFGAIYRWYNGAQNKNHEPSMTWTVCY